MAEWFSACLLSWHISVVKLDGFEPRCCPSSTLLGLRTENRFDSDSPMYRDRFNSVLVRNSELNLNQLATQNQIVHERYTLQPKPIEGIKS